jgi:hypothetical protein
MKLRLRLSNRFNLRLKRRLRNVAIAATFASLVGVTYFLYEFIGNVTLTRAQLLEEKKKPVSGVLEGFSGRKRISIERDKISGQGILSNFIVPICFRDDDLKLNSHGGQVYNKDGNDLVFTAADGLTILPFQIERYEPEIGKLTAWVRFDTLNSKDSSGSFYLYFGNAQAGSVESQSTFSKPFEAAWHLNGNFQNAGTNKIAGEYKGIKDEEGRFGGGKDFLGYEAACASFSYIDKSDYSGNVSVSAWIKTNGSYTDQLIYCDNGKSGGCSLGIDKNGKVIFELNNASGQRVSVQKSKGGKVITNKQWYHIAGIYNAAKDSIFTYVNGAIDRSAKSGLIYHSNDHVTIGSDLSGKSGFFNGLIDELRISSEAYSSDYMHTQYIAESAPEQFIKLDGKEVFSASPRIVQLKLFEATVKESYVSVNWQTLSEISLDYFTLERSTDGVEFSKVATQFASGNSEVPRNYFLLDPAPVFGNAYYRLRFTGFKGESDISNTLNVHFAQTASTLGIRKIEPNPFKDNFSVVYTSDAVEPMSVKITSISGQIVHSESLTPKSGSENYFEYRDTKHLSPGIYFLSLSQASEQKTVKLIKRL